MGAITRHFRALILQTLMFAVFLLCAPSLTNAQDVTSGLVGHWKLEDTNTTVAATTGPNGTMNGGLSGATDSVAAKIGNGLQLDGVDDSINLGNTGIVNNIFASGGTIAAWFWIDPAATGYRVFDKDSAGAGYIFTSSGEFEIKNGSNIGRWSVGAPPTGQWVHVAIIYDVSSTTNDPLIYYNAVSQTVSETTAPTGTGTDDSGQNLHIGNREDLARPMDGTIDDVRIYNRALSANDVALLYASYPGPVTCNAAYEAVMWYNQDESVMQYCDGTNWIDMGPGKYTPNAVALDGTTDRLNALAPVTGAVDDKRGTMSFWFKADATTANSNLFHMTNASLRASFNGNEMRISAWNAGLPASVLDLRTTTLGGDTSSWHHIMASWDTGTPGAQHLYLDGVADMNVVTFVDNVLDYDVSNFAVGASTAGSNFYDGEIADLWIDMGTYIDLSVAANRQKFYNNGPVNLGADGSAPTGTSPEIFFSGDTATWQTNDGTGGGSNEVGALTDGSIITGSSTCSSPAGVAGEVDYNFDDGTMQYCNGANWVNMGPKIAGTGGTGFTYTAPTTGLQGHWTLDETSGTTFADSSGNGYTGTAAGGLDATNDSVAGQDGTAIEFDDDDDIDMGDIINLSGQQSHTLSIWVRFNVDPLSYSTQFINNGDINLWWNGANNFGIGDDVIFFDFDDGGTARGFANATGGPHPWNPAINTWYMVTGVHDTVANETYLYIDGQLVGTRTGITQALATSANTANIGASGTAGSAVQFDDGRIYDTALTAQEVYSLYRATGGTNLGLVHHWELNETATGPAVDSGSGASNGTMTGGLDAATDSTAGQFGTALTFNGTSDYIDTNTSLEFPNGSLTVTGWAKTSNTGGQRILSKYNTGGNQKWLLTDASTDTIECGFHDGTGGVSSIITTATTIADGNWHFYACSVTGSDVTAYYDGVAGPTVIHDGTLLTNGSNWEIGRLSTGGEYWNGDLDDIRIYDRALTAAEIADLYAAGAGGNVPQDCTGLGDAQLTGINGNCYYRVDTPANWNTAKTNCEANGAHLAVISTASESTLLHTNWFSGSGQQYWIGGSDSGVEGTWIWNGGPDDGRTFWIGNFSGSAQNGYYQKWATAGGAPQPDNSGGPGEDCLEVSDAPAPWDADWNDGDCSWNNRYVCEKSSSLAGGTCSNPPGPAGEMIYNDDQNVMQYCNGSEWVGVR